MGDDDTADRPPVYDPGDARYFGPFGRPSADSGAPHEYHLPDDTFPATAASWPPPAPATAPRTGSHAVPRPSRGRGVRGGAVIAVAALTALLVGGAARYGGALLA
ncbi:MAG TPA: hypothetical protein VE617_07685, partial [Propionibacteriaceae bacterium]|nr:hypothetical protein [Propionibacteriaceae bacterium]